METHEDDAHLVSAMGEGDRDALARLYDRHAPALRVKAARLLGDRRDAEDLVHDVMLEVHRHASDYDDARGSVRAWMLTRLRSRALDRLKRATRVTSVDPARLFEVPCDEDASASADRSRVLRALAALPDAQRVVLELTYFDGCSSSEIAARVAAPIGTVKSRVAAGLARLRAACSLTGPTTDD
ncbi:MAG: sigma-70 family RNA polymerase sigma factor [Deltaproteobacteria bacterium]|nr:sigma-70 family RNA polymerase sigma factor [Deltaproteobacteria bacterium]